MLKHDLFASELSGFGQLFAYIGKVLSPFGFFMAFPQGWVFPFEYHRFRFMWPLNTLQMRQGDQHESSKRLRMYWKVTL